MGFLSPQRLTENLPSLGVDIGSHVVNLAQLRQRSSRIELYAAGAFAVGDSMIERGVVREPRKLGKQISNFLRKHEVGPSAGVFSVPSNLAALRWVQLPDLPAEDLRDAARYKVKRHLPFPVHSAYVEATPPIALEGDELGQSLVIAVPRDIIDSRAEAIEYAGLIPAAAELEAQAILRVVERRLSEQSALWRDASLTIMDIGMNNTHMYVVQNQRLQFIRGVRFGSAGLIQKVSKELGVSPAEAEAGLSSGEAELWTDGILKLPIQGQPAFVYVDSEMEKLTREFMRLLRYFRSLHPERSYAGILDHALVCGGLASLRGLADYLHSALELRVELARPLSGLIGKFDRESFHAITRRQEAYTVVIGLALSGLGGLATAKGESDGGREFAWTRTA